MKKNKTVKAVEAAQTVDYKELLITCKNENNKLQLEIIKQNEVIRKQASIIELLEQRLAGKPAIVITTLSKKPAPLKPTIEAL